MNRWLVALALVPWACASCSHRKSPQDPLRIPWEMDPTTATARRMPRAPGNSLPDYGTLQPVIPSASDAREHVSVYRAYSPCLSSGCHKDVATTPWLHSRVAIGSCERCHAAATGNPEDHSFLPVKDDGGVCQTCHPPRPTKKFGHVPFLETKCLSCHDPHGARTRALLIHETAAGTCLPCHESPPDDDKKVLHGPYAVGDCLACHDPHQSDFKSLTHKKSADLCLGCHNREIGVGNGVQVVADMGTLISTSPFRHGPIRDGECDGCHAAHGSPNARLLRRAYPGSFYQAYDETHYALCFQCHDRDLTRTERTTTLTNFRDGDRNLHFLHVNNEKGRSCRACHEVHASNLPFHMRESVPFGPGRWELPINFHQTETGGSCKPGCHEAVAYDNSRTAG